MAPLLSVVIPTYNEAANIAPLLRELETHFAGRDVEYVVVDDDSKDGTAQAAAAATPRARVIVRKDERGLATAVVRGMREAQGTWVAVMDADFQHPPEAVRRLLERAEETGADLVIGSRYASGGSEGGFGLHRRVISWGASFLSRVLLPPVRKQGLSDPMTGLFLVRRDRVDLGQLRPTGYKILLEIIGRSPIRSVAEVGYVFQDRRGGQSKLGSVVVVQYLLHVLALAWTHPENRRILRFGLVGLSGVVVNLGLLWMLHGRLGVTDLVAQPIAVEVSIISNFFLNDRFTFHDRREGHHLGRLAKFNAVSLVALAVNFATFLVLTRGLGVHYLAAAAVGILVAFATNYSGNMSWTYGQEERFRLRQSLRSMVPWLPFVLLVGGASWLYMHDLDRIDEIYFDEHYYISVAHQMDNGIWEDPCWERDELDHRPLNFEHPPLGKLIIALSVSRYDTTHEVFEGCRDPDGSGKEDYDAYTANLRENGNPYAWRMPSAIFGVACVLFVALAARRIFNDDRAGVLAGAFVALDGLLFTSARLGILDVFAAGFTAAAAWAATHPTRRGYVGTAILLGLGFSCKYYVLFAGIPIFVLAMWSQRRAGVLTRRRFDGMLAAFAVFPAMILLLTFLPWWRIWIPEMGVVGAFEHWADVMRSAFERSTVGNDNHSYQSRPGMWLPMERPVWYYKMTNAGGNEGINRYVYTVGNPVLWWSATAVVLALPFVWWRSARRRLRAQRAAAPAPTEWAEPSAQPALPAAETPPAPQAPARPFWVPSPDLQALLAAALVPTVAYLGFFALQRTTFIFYMTLVVPLMGLPLGGALALAWRRGGWRREAVLLLTALAVAAFLYYYPVVAAQDISEERFNRIMDTIPWMRE